MKTSNQLWAIAIALALFTSLGYSAETNAPAPPPPAPSPSNWWTDFSISPYGTVAHPDFGKPVWGAGLDIGYAINRTVSMHLANTIFDYDNAGWCDHAFIDETEVIFRADLIRGGGAGKDRFVAFVLGSGGRNWEIEDWAFGVGVGAELRLTRNIGIGVDSRIRAWMHQEKDLMTRGFVSLRF